MKTYLKPDVEVTDVGTRQVFTLDTYSTPGATGTIHTKQNNDWEWDEEDEDGGLW
ncbi:MAG: hypothetical protein LUC49_06370 [Prevotella sp.]|nr:hypothetical protein [Prevotella sp.]MCD8306263.1 hypothetical protein [Prevotella sp.]